MCNSVLVVLYGLPLMPMLARCILIDPHLSRVRYTRRHNAGFWRSSLKVIFFEFPMGIPSRWWF